MDDPVTLRTLIAVNREFFDSRWSEKDLEELVNPHFGVVSDLSSLVERLSAIRAKDLADQAPFWIVECQP
ncbi:hypothetical protein VOI32_37455 [Paraburkholderia caribensis]|uniref:Uncharacterized protein n=1 Tax=Paraburkholderia caribensis TaxID=75105 RepID=A0ABV0EBA5_9BURK|nr:MULTISPECIES: hypothetical protein [Paraburkholderia]MCO4882302.1 hypothetical protein [Paraburkholderia caribensis]PTB24424.1 hypothetical protein C9I56_33900 [Paraburkholderia caribensis]